MKRKSAILLTLLLFSPWSFAGNVSGAKIFSLAATTQDAYLVGVTIDNSSPPDCVKFKRRYAFKISTPGGKAMLGTLLTAQMADSFIDVAGAGNCSVWSDSETAKSISVRNGIPTPPDTRATEASSDSMQ